MIGSVQAPDQIRGPALPAGRSTGRAPEVFFIGHRTSDGGAYAHALALSLKGILGPDAAYLDAHDLKGGGDVPRSLRAALMRSHTMVAVIGPDWVTAADETGARRLWLPGDLVRMELELALALELQIVPLLVGGAQMPKAEELPESLRRLADFKAVDGSHERFSEAVESLVAMAPRGVAVDTGVARPRAVLPDLMLSLPVLLGLACAVVGILELRAFDLVGLADELRPLSSGLAICGLGAIAMHLAVLGPRPGLLLSGGLVATLGLSLASMFAGWWLMGTMEDTRSHVLAALPGALAGSAAVAACWLDARS